MDLTQVIALLAVVAVPAGAYLGTRRASSGRVDQSAPAELWAEGRAIRADLRAELALLRAEVVTLKAQLTLSQNTIARLEQERRP